MVALVSVVCAACDSTPPPSVPASAVPGDSPLPTQAPLSTPTLTISAQTTALVDAGSALPTLNAVAFASDARHGWVGGSGILLATADGGTSWQVQWTGDRTVTEIQVLNRSEIWAIGIKDDAGGRTIAASLLRTSDGGEHWISSSIDPTISSLDVASSTVAWAIKGADVAGVCGAACVIGGQLVRTADGGRTWFPGASNLKNARGTCFTDPRHGYAAIDDHVYATTDAGLSWHRRAALPSGEGEGVAWMSCSPSALWLLVNLDGGAGGHINYAAYRSLSGGPLVKVLGNAFYGIPPGLATADDEPGPLVAPDALTAIELGVSPAAEEMSVTITHDGGRHWRKVSLQDVESQGGAIAFPDPLHGWIATNTWGRGEILATIDGGLSWHEQYPAQAPHPVGDISFVSATHGFGVGIPGDANAFVETTDAGDTWKLVGRLPAAAAFVAGPAFGGAKQLSFADAMHGWVATASGRLLASTDGGRTWDRVTVPTTALVDGVGLGRGGLGCIAISDETSPATTELRTSDGGRTWSSIDPYQPLDACARGEVGLRVVDAVRIALAPSFSPFLAFAGDTTAWAFLGTGLARTTDGGATWAEIDWPIATDESQAPISGGVASFGDPFNGWILVSDGSIYRTSDGGFSWSRIP